MQYTDLLKTIWKTIYDSGIDTRATIKKYFHPDYEQCINGVILNREQYIEHVEEQKQRMTISSIDYQHTLEKENELFALYYPKGKTQQNLPLEAEVIAYFNFKNQQIYRIHGAVRLIKGDLSDVDMQKN